MKDNKFFEYLYKNRIATEYAEYDIFCFDDEAGNSWGVTMKEFPHSWIKSDRESSKRGGKLKARIRPSAIEKRRLLGLPTCRLLGKRSDLEAAYAEAYMKARGKKAPKNAGWVYECAVTERWAGKTWEPDQVPYWEAGDVEMNGTSYQIKGDGAEYFTETNVMAAMEALGLC